MIAEKELISLAITAGETIRDVYERGSWEMTVKMDSSPLTEADRASHRILVEGLSRIAPGIPILSEESDEIPFETRKNWESYFLIDPLDGTREFVAKIPEFAINIALVEKGLPVLGLVHSPLQRTTFYAEKGKGAYRLTQHREALPIASESFDSLRVLLSRTDETPDLERLLSKLPPHTVSRLGSSLKFCAVAEGKAEFYPRLKPSMEWDTAAGTILVEESGGIVFGLNGKRIEYNRPDMLNPPFFVMGKAFFNKFPDWKKLFTPEGGPPCPPSMNNSRQ